MLIKRSSRHSLKFTTPKKKKLLDDLFDIYSQYLQDTIDLFWDQPKVLKFLSSKDIYWMGNLGGQYKALIYKQASEIIRSCKFKKGKKTKPIVKNFTITLDNRVVEIQQSNNSFDKWLVIKLPFIKKNTKRNRIEILIPIKDHRHSLKFKNFNLCNSIIISRSYATLIYEKEVEMKQGNKVIGMDCGYKKLFVTSDNQRIGTELESKINKITRKVRGSKAYERALIERDSYINKELKTINFKELDSIVIEDLKNVKKNSKLHKKFNNKLQYWVYSKAFKSLETLCEDNRVNLYRVNPKNTSRTCSRCGSTHKSNRIGEIFKCINCGYTEDADFQASLNILNLYRLQENTVPVNKKNKLLSRTI